MGVMGETEIREHLMANSEEFRRLAAEHGAYSDELDALIHRTHLTEEEKIQEITLKKKKLMLKDQMHMMVQKQRRELEEAAAEAAR